MVGGGEHEPEADVLDALRDRGRRQIDAGAERLEQVGRTGQAGRRSVAVLGDRAARAGSDQRGGRRDVECPAPAAGAGGVEQVGAGDRDPSRALTHGPGEAGELVDRLPFRAQRDEERGDLDLRRIAGHDLREHRGGLLEAEVVP